MIETVKQLNQLALAAHLIKRSKQRDNSDLYQKIESQLDLANAEKIIQELGDVN